MADHAICVTCGVQYEDAGPERCPVCEDPRQYVREGGQAWTTLPELRRAHHNHFVGLGVDEVDEADEAIITEPRFAIGQRALLVAAGEQKVMWDCLTLLDEDTATLIERRGGLAAIAISHPHYYSTMVEWARRLSCPVYLHEADREWIMRPDPHLRLWSGERHELGHGLTLIHTPGHFAGATVMHSDRGAGTLYAGDICLAVPDRRYVTFQWSYPNRVPLPAADVRRIGDAVAPFAFQTIRCAFPGMDVADGQAVWDRSIRRFTTAVQTLGGSG
jgi:hypothetical protein